MIIKPHVPNPCAEDWERMKIGLNSRFCDNCKKDIKDFTGMSRHEILSYIFSNHEKQICGRFKKTQLDFTHSDLLLTIETISKNPKNSNVAFYLLTMSALLIAGCSDDTNQGRNHKSTLSIDFDSQDIKTDSTIETTNACDQLTGIVLPQEPVLLGEPSIISEDTVVQNRPYLVVDTMPEFYGGTNGLTDYIKKNLIYPLFERENKIQGTVLVSFTVDETGKIRDAKILKGVPGARTFDQEVLKLVNQMPMWKPGSLNGQVVEVRFNLPIKFKL